MSNYVVRARKMLGDLTQVEFAKLLNVSRHSVMRWEADGKLPPLRRMQIRMVLDQHVKKRKTAA